MQTVHEIPTAVNPQFFNWNSEPVLTAIERDYRHGEDRAILGLSLERCQNDRQAQGWEHMYHHLAAFAEVAADGPCAYVDAWAATLEARRAEADRRRAWALAIEAEADAILEEMESPFYSGHEHEMEVA